MASKRLFDSLEAVDARSAINRRAWRTNLEAATQSKAVANNRQGTPRERAPRARTPSETSECKVWLEWTTYVVYQGEPLRTRIAKVANERPRSVMAAVLAAIGVSPGFPDYIIAAPCGRFAGLFLEAKRRKDGSVEPEQIAWRDNLLRWGYHAAICQGAHEMIAETKVYFAHANTGDWIDATRLSA